MSPLPLAIRSGIAETHTRLPAGVFRGEPTRETRLFFMGKVRFDLFSKIAISLGSVDRPPQTHLLIPSAYLNDSPRIRPMARVIFLQRPVAAFSSFRPLFVSR